MSGFSNPVVSNTGSLSIASVHSPNFVTGVTGWTINKDGSAEFNNGTFRGTITGAVFRATNAFGATVMTINKSTGTWLLYADTGSSTQGALVASGAGMAGTDEFGNGFGAGVESYVTDNTPDKWAIQIAEDTLFAGPGLQFTDNTRSQFRVPRVTATRGAVQSSLILYSGMFNNTALPAEIDLFDTGVINLLAQHVVFGNSQAAQWNDTTSSLELGAGTGPFIPGESFHNLSNPAGITGTARVKKLPWNAIWYEGQVNNSGSAAATFTFGSPPDATYNPLTASVRPVGSNGVPTAVAAAPRLFIPTSGGPQLIVPAMGATNVAYGWSIMIAPN